MTCSCGGLIQVWGHHYHSPTLKLKCDKCKKIERVAAGICPVCGEYNGYPDKDGICFQCYEVRQHAGKVHRV